MQNNLTETEPEYVSVMRTLFNKVADPKNWKNATKPFETLSKKEAEDMRDAIVFFVGGAEVQSVESYVQHVEGLVRFPVTSYLVTSKGYYHYIGA